MSVEQSPENNKNSIEAAYVNAIYNAEKYIENQYNQIKNQTFYNNIKNINCTIFRRNIYNDE